MTQNDGALGRELFAYARIKQASCGGTDAQRYEAVVVTRWPNTRSAPFRGGEAHWFCHGFVAADVLERRRVVPEVDKIRKRDFIDSERLSSFSAADIESGAINAST
jgi:hypothetical protein